VKFLRLMYGDDIYRNSPPGGFDTWPTARRLRSYVLWPVSLKALVPRLTFFAIARTTVLTRL
jgi:hypothetical protein